MNVFKDYLADLPEDEARAIERVIRLVRDYVPEAKEGLSYGLPAFKYKNRPLIGFSSNKYGLNIYPFDPRIVTEVKSQLNGYEVSKGVIRFTPEKPVPEDIIKTIIDLRLEILNQ